jgi:hypothetical protein
MLYVYPQSVPCKLIVTQLNKGRRIEMKRSLMIWLAVFSLAFAVSCGGGKNTKNPQPGPAANENHGTATGYATVYDNDEGLARDRAMEDASRKLVESVLGNTVSGSSLVQDFQLVSSIIESTSLGMVKNVKVLKQQRDGDSYMVTIEGDVFPAAVGAAIKTAIENYGRPKFMVLLRETFEGKRNEPGMTVTELSIMDTMGTAGFQFVDAAMVLSLMKKDRADMTKAMSGQVKGDEGVQSLILEDAGAEVIILGDVQTSDQSGALKQFGPNWKSKRAIVNLKAIDVYTGDVVATVSADGAGADINADAASKKAIQACLGSNKVLGRADDGGQFQPGNFMNQITRKFIEAATRRPIQLRVGGLDNKQMIKFREFLTQRIRGVKKVEVKGQQGLETKLEVLFSGKTVDLTDEFANKGQGGGYDIKIVKSYPNKIQMVVKASK